jgi:predicted PurR-regulated permease PerM
MSNQPTSLRLEQRVALVVLALLLLGCLLVMRPFISALLWAIVLCFSSWPAYGRLLGLLRGRRSAAAMLMSLAMVLTVLVPFVVIGTTLADSVKEFIAATRAWMDAGPSAPPVWLAGVPLIGTYVSDYWSAAALDSTRLMADAKRWIEPTSSVLLQAALAVGRGVLQLTLSVFIAFFLFRDGPTAAERLTSAVQRIAGERGKHLLNVAGATVRSVVYGILGTALVQAVMAGVGFFIAGVPGAALLTLLTFFLSVVPLGPPLVWVPAALWLFRQGEPGWGVFMIVWGVGVSSVDNFVKPWLISQGSNLPFILIFFGVIGGALAFGFIGVFLGPTLLAVGFRLSREWFAVRGGEARDAA